MTPFAIKLTLATPIVFVQNRQNTALCLDAVLAGLRRARGLDPFDLPLEQTRGLWHASAAFMRCGADSFKRTVNFSRSFDSGLQHHDRAMRTPVNAPAGSGFIRVGDSKGEFKQLMNAYDRVSVSELRWWGCGDAEAVRDLLALLVIDTPNGPLPGYGIGRHANGGYGEVASVALDVTQDDRSIAVGNRPMRPVPLPLWQSIGHSLDVQIASCAWQYPYYQTEKNRCAVPPTQLITRRLRDFLTP